MAKIKGLRSYFRDKYLPDILAMGMSEELFWTMNPTKIKPYVEAERKKDIKHDYWNWMLGAYVKSSIASALDKHNKYSDKPYLEKAEDERVIDGSELSEAEQEIERHKLMAAMGFNMDLLKGGQ